MQLASSSCAVLIRTCRLKHQLPSLLLDFLRCTPFLNIHASDARIRRATYLLSESIEYRAAGDTPMAFLSLVEMIFVRLQSAEGKLSF